MTNRALPALFLAAALSVPAFAAPKDEVGAVLRKTVDGVLSIVRNKKLGRQQMKDQVMQVVTPVFDFPVMAKLTLGRTHWPKLDAGQQKEFTDLFIQQLQASYLDKVELVSDEKVVYDALVESNGKITAGTRVSSKDEPIKIVYKFHKSSAGWKVFDVEIQDVSLVKSYGQQYAQILQQGSVKDLIAKMKEKIAETERLNKQQRQNRKNSSQTKT
jgi:phospholipid transport system substrate-binding protein